MVVGVEVSEEMFTLVEVPIEEVPAALVLTPSPQDVSRTIEERTNRDFKDFFIATSFLIASILLNKQINVKEKGREEVWVPLYIYKVNRALPFNHL